MSGEVTVASLLGDAQSETATLTATAIMVVTAFGAPGGHPATGGTAGESGKASTAMTEAAWVAAYGDSIYYYPGTQLEQSSSELAGGGSSTIVADANLTSVGACIRGVTGCTTSNVLVEAGGGGGGGEAGRGDGGNGGKGGVATDDKTTTAIGTGTDGGKGADGGHGGAGGGDGNGGAGGHGGTAGVTAKSGGNGQDGPGGEGGSVHTSSGPGAAAGWATKATIRGINTAGAGGEGEWRGSVRDGAGGGGGGGFGGGGGGGSGGKGHTFAGGGGGGGGSYAVKATATVPDNLGLTAPNLPTSIVPASDGIVYVSFVH